MKATTPIKSKKSRKIWIPIVAVLILAAGAAGYFFWTQKNVTAANAADTSYKTTTVKTGSITISVSGSGTLLAGEESELSFSTSGTVAKVNVAVGDVVKKGDVLAALGNLDQLQANVSTAQQDLVTAQSELQILKDNASANIGNAQLALATAQKALTDAQSAVVQKGMTRCTQTEIDDDYQKYLLEKQHLDALGVGDGGREYYLYTIVPQKNKVAQAYATYVWCSGYTDYEIASTNADVTIAQADVKTKQAALDTLQKNNGVDPIELATAENKVTSAQLALTNAQEILAGTTLTAPFDGTILSVAGKAGDTSGTTAFITIADLAHPQVQFSVDETDMNKVSVGEQATVVFDALPDSTFSGKVTQINPSLVSSGGYMVVQGQIQLDLTKDQNASKLLKSMNGTVKLVQASAENVLLVPVEAVRDLGDGTYSVFVLGKDGSPKLTVVEVGLQDAASVEIKSGLTAGQTVTTGTIQTK